MTHRIFRLVTSLFLTMAVIAISSGSRPVSAKPLSAPFQITDLGTLGGCCSIANNINGSGQVVGDSDISSGATHAFLWQNGTMTDLGTLSYSSFARFINESGQVAGDSWDAGHNVSHAFFWENGTMTDLGTLGGGPFHSSQAKDLNEHGQVVGFSDLESFANHAFIWENGTMTALGSLGGSDAGSVANAINDLGQVVGTSETSSSPAHAFFWENGTMTDLGTLGGTSSSAFAINNHGQVVGSSTTASSETHAFIWENGIMTDLGTLGGAFTEAKLINEGGQITGLSLTASNELHPFLWQNGTMTDLGTLGGSLLYVIDLNATGQVVGYGYIPDIFGEQHAFVWQDGILTDLGMLGSPGSAAMANNDHGQIVGQSKTASGDSHAVLWTAASINEVSIDIKPGRFPNRIKLARNVCRDDDNLYVAILTTPTFNARTVDVSTLQLGDPNLSGKATPIRSRVTDVDRDGDRDIVLTFTLCSIVTNGALNINSTEMVLTGTTLEGVSFTGRDSVKVVR